EFFHRKCISLKISSLSTSVAYFSSHIETGRNCETFLLPPPANRLKRIKCYKEYLCSIYVEKERRRIFF
ncbi:hypothetical protein BDA99DRAFT_506834, partial [Phascolomyces articulosus]